MPGRWSGIDGIEAVAADLDDCFDGVVAAAGAADATIYAAQVAFEFKLEVLRPLCEALAGAGKAFVILAAATRSSVARQVHGVRTSSPRTMPSRPSRSLPPALGPGASRGPLLMTVCARCCAPAGNVGFGRRRLGGENLWPVAATGAVRFVGSGLAVYSNVHSADLARLFELFLGRSKAGALYYAVGGE